LFEQCCVECAVSPCGVFEDGVEELSLVRAFLSLKVSCGVTGHARDLNGGMEWQQGVLVEVVNLLVECVLLCAQGGRLVLVTGFGDGPVEPVLEEDVQSFIES
jgi:hypothetical protein